MNEGTIRGLVAICEDVIKMRHMDALQPFVLVTNANEWIQLCTYIHNQAEQHWDLFGPQATFDQISGGLSTIIDGGNFSKASMPVIEVTHRAIPGCRWDSIASRFQDRLSPDQTPSNEEINAILLGLCLLLKLGCAQAQSSLETLAANGSLLHWLHQSHSQGNIACAAQVMSTYLELYPGAEKTGAVGNSELGYTTLMNILAADEPQIVKYFVDILDTEGKLSFFFSIADKRGVYDPFIGACLRQIADSGLPGRLFTPELVVGRWQALQAQLNKGSDDRFDKLLGFLCLNSLLVTAMQNSEGRFRYQDAGFYLSICNACLSQPFREWCRAGLETLDSKVWISQLNEAGKALDLVVFLRDEGQTVDLKQSFQDALVDYAKRMIKGSAAPSQDLVKEWPKLLGSLGSPASRNVFRRRLLSEATMVDGKCADAFFQLYGEELTADASLYSENKEVVAKLFSPLLRERRIVGLRWLHSIFAKMPDVLVKSADSDAAEDFIERLKGEQRRPANEGDEVHALIMEIATMLGIPEEIVNGAEGVALDSEQTEEPK